MNINKISLWICSLLLSSLSLLAQDPEFSQFYAAPVYTNGAMIGFSEAPRINVSFRDQMASFVPDAFITSAISYDQYFYNLRSSIGATFSADIAGNLLNTYQFHGLYAYTLPLTDTYAFKLGFQAGVIQQNINQGNLVFSDMINPNSVTENFTNTTSEAPLGKTNITAFDLGAGFVVYSSRLFMGAYFKHINTPSFSYSTDVDNDNQLETRISFQIGNTFYLNDPFFDKHQIYIAPALLFVNQGAFNQINVGAYAGRGAIFTGFWFRHTIKNADALIWMFGVKKGIFRAAYSHDFNLSQLQTSAGAHEISLSFDLGQDPYIKKKARMRETIKCPEMFQ